MSFFQTVQTEDKESSEPHPLLTPEQQAWIAAHPVIKVSADNAWAPFDYKSDEGQHTGLSHDLLKSIAQLTGLKFEYHMDKWSSALEKVQQKKFDLLPAAYKSKERESQLLFTEPYYESPSYFFIRKNSEILRLNKSSRYRLAIVSDYGLLPKIKRLFPNLEIVTYSAIYEAIDAVSDGRADLLYDSHAVVAYWINEKSVANLVPFRPLPNEPSNALRMAVRADYVELVPILNAALANIAADKNNLVFERWGIVKAKSLEPTIFLTEAEKLWLAENPKISFAGDPDWMPYESFDEKGNYIGMVPEYLKLIEDALGVEIEVTQTDLWTEAVDLFNQGKLDILSSSIGNKSLINAYYSNPYISGPHVLVMRDKNPYVEDISEVLSENITLFTDDDFTKDLMQRFPDKVFTIGSSSLGSLQDLAEGNTDVVVVALARASYLIGLHGLSNLRVVGETKYSVNIGFAVNPKNQPLVSILNKTLNTISVAKKRVILSNWRSSDQVVKVDYILTLQIILISLLILGFITQSNRKLKKEIVLRRQIESSLKQSETNLKTLIDGTPIIIFVTKKGSANLLMANPTACTELGIDPSCIGDFSGSDFHYFNQPKTAINSVLKEFNQKDRVTKKIIKLQSINGGIIDGMLSISPLKYEKKSAYLNIVVNLNERIALEKQLEKAKNIAESANKAKSEFLANMSHEIRTPMNAIIGFTELLDEELQDKKLLSYVDTIGAAGNALLILINDILDLSKIEAGKISIKLEPVDTSKIFKEIINIFEMNAKRKKIQLILEVASVVPSSLLLDPIRVRQVLFNLMGNAVKFTDGGFVKLCVKAESHDEIKSSVDLKIEVIDSGCGIKPNSLATIFKDFGQSEGQSYKKYGGTGLGLSISRRLIHLMGGEIAVKSESGKGSNFSFKLRNVPVSKQKLLDDKPDLPLDIKQVKFEPARILIVDDIEPNRILLKKTFEKFHFDTDQASDGEQAVSKVKSNDYDVIIMDIRMPKMDGYEASRLIKSDYPSIPIIALTASVIESGTERSKNEVFDGFLSKPILRKELVKELKKHLRHKMVL